MPPFYTRTPVCDSDALRAREVWSMISGNGGSEYEASVNDRRISEEASCLTWFYNVFTERMRNLSPSCTIYTNKTSFADTRLLLQVIVVVLSIHNQQDAKFKSRLHKLYHSIELYNITFFDLSALGEALLYSLNKCLGEEYTPEINTSWKVLYSAFLTLMYKSFYCKRRFTGDTLPLSVTAPSSGRSQKRSSGCSS